MTLATLVKATEETPVLPTKPIPARFQPRFGLAPIFSGPDGLRAGWRLLIFLALLGVPAAALRAIANTRGGGAGQITITPFFMGANEAMALLILCLVTWIMSKIEHRKFSEYGLPLRQALGRDFWIGSLSGFLAISGTLLAMFLLHGFRVTGLALHGTAIVYSVAGWGITFLLVGLFEEFLCRGYLQFTLASGIGFWPAALVISSLFGLGHAFNPNETAVGAVAAGMFGLLFCLFLRRTRNLWIPVGFHAAWDWGQMLYGVPDSGIVPYHNLLHSTLSGPRWLTGGIVGPEASVLTPIALLVVAMIFNRYYREDRNPILRAL
jgi:uncharacterized protein